jgi:hypothetical protein
VSVLSKMRILLMWIGQLFRNLGISVGPWSDLGLKSCTVAISVERLRSVDGGGGRVDGLRVAQRGTMSLV